MVKPTVVLHRFVYHSLLDPNYQDLGPGAGAVAGTEQFNDRTFSVDFGSGGYLDPSKTWMLGIESLCVQPVGVAGNNNGIFAVRIRGLVQAGAQSNSGVIGNDAVLFTLSVPFGTSYLSSNTMAIPIRQPTLLQGARLRVEILNPWSMAPDDDQAYDAFTASFVVYEYVP
jgi:hypothetical protein